MPKLLRTVIVVSYSGVCPSRLMRPCWADTNSTWQPGVFTRVQWQHELRWQNKQPQVQRCTSDICERLQYWAVWARTLDYENPGFESCAAVLKPWARFFTLHCSSSLSCINEYLAIGSGGYVYEQPSRINGNLRLDAYQRIWDGVWLYRSVREVKCKTGYCAI